jgi:hypothetical protein
MTKGYQIFLELHSGCYLFKKTTYLTHRDAEFALIDMMSFDSSIIGGDVIPALVPSIRDLLVRKDNSQPYGEIDYSEPTIFNPEVEDRLSSHEIEGDYDGAC